MIKQEIWETSKGFVRNVWLDHLAFYVKSSKKVDEIYKIVTTLGYKITRQPNEYPEYSEWYYAFYFRDPNGIPLEVFYKD